MERWKEGDSSEAICPGGEQRVATRFERGHRAFGGERSGRANVLVGVCTRCNATVAIPAQSTPAIGGRAA